MKKDQQEEVKELVEVKDEVTLMQKRTTVDVMQHDTISKSDDKG